MKSKVLIDPQRKRRVPKHFSWLDHRLVRDNYLKQCSTDALALYLFLVTVGDCEGLSYYRDESIEKYLTFTPSSSLNSCRKELISASLVAFHDGLYQVLGLTEVDIPGTEFAKALKHGRDLKRNDLSANSNVECIGSVIDKIFGGK